jgi:hypothetical protein
VNKFSTNLPQANQALTFSFGLVVLPGRNGMASGFFPLSPRHSW